MNFRQALCCSGLLSLLLSGCTGAIGPEIVTDKTAHVNGYVMFNNQPLTKGNVVLYSSNSGASYEAPLGSDGGFKLDEPIPPVNYMVYFRTAEGGLHTGVPEKYRSETSTDQNVTVNAGDNNLQINLQR